MTLGLTQPLIEMSTVGLPWEVMVPSAQGWQPYHFYVLII